MKKKILEEMNFPKLPPEFPKTMENLRELLILYSCAVNEINTKLENLNNEFKLKQDRNPIQYINHRIKSPESILLKMHRNNVEMNMKAMRENISDIAGIRVICSYITDVYSIADMLIRQDDIKLIRTKDYINNPKESGYRSLHLIIETPVFLSNEKQMVKVEVQIRTIAMDFWASLEHQLRYKMNMNIPEDIRVQLKKNAESVYQLDLDMQKTYEEIEKLKNPEEMK